MHNDAASNRVTGAAIGELAKAAREMYWNECGLEQKVERVRECLLGVENALASSVRRSDEALKVAKYHGHTDQRPGGVAMPVIETVPQFMDVESIDVRRIFRRLK